MADERLRSHDRRARAGDPEAADALAQARARLGVPVCWPHHTPRPYAMCSHLAARTDHGEYRVCFTGEGTETRYLCVECEPPGRDLVDSCATCVRTLHADSWLVDVVGRPGIRERPVPGMRVHRVRVDLPSIAAVQDLAPVREGWLAITADGRLHQLDLRAGKVVRSSPPSWHGLSAAHEGLRLFASTDGELAVVVERGGSRGVVLESWTVRPLRRLSRPSSRSYPCALVDVAGRCVLAFDPGSGVIELSDARTGSPIETASQEDDEPRYVLEPPPVHGALSVSPDGAWLTSDAFDFHGGTSDVILRRIRAGDVEDGGGPVALCERAGPCESAAAWRDATTVAVYGYGLPPDRRLDPDERRMGRLWEQNGERAVIPAALVFDVRTKDLVTWFAGPRPPFMFSGGLLLSGAEVDGTAVWDVGSGERLMLDARPPPTHVHPVTGELARVHEGEVHLLALVEDQPPDSAT